MLLCSTLGKNFRFNANDKFGREIDGRNLKIHASVANKGWHCLYVIQVYHTSVRSGNGAYHCMGIRMALSILSILDSDGGCLGNLEEVWQVTAPPRRSTRGSSGIIPLSGCVDRKRPRNKLRGHPSRRSDILVALDCLSTACLTEDAI